METIRKVFMGVKEINEKERTLVSVVSTGAVDRMGEVIEPEGIDLKNYRKNPIVLWAHNYGSPPIGRSLWIKKQNGGLVSKMEFAKTERAEEIFSLYKGGFLNAFSIGFSSIESEPMDKNDTSFFGPKRFKKTEMLEYSAVPVPANPEALAMAMTKGLKLDEDIKQAIENTHLDDIETVQKEEVKKEETNPLDELLSENKNLSEKCLSLEKENKKLQEESAQLRFNNYKLIMEKQKPEITSHVVADNIRDVVRGVIRQMQGKLD